MNFRICAVAIVVALAGLPMAGQAAKATKPAKTGKIITLPDRLQYEDVVVGKGVSPKPGQTVTVGYVGTLTNGKQFDANKSFSFNIGVGQVIPGWDQGVM